MTKLKNCQPEDATKEPDSDENSDVSDTEVEHASEIEIQDYIKFNKTKEGNNVNLSTTGYLVKQIISAGNPLFGKPEKGYLAEIELKGQLVSTGAIFLDRTVHIILGDRNVVHGLDIAIYTMHKFEQAEVTMDASFGYGQYYCRYYPGCVIPIDSDLKFKVYLKDFHSINYERDEEICLQLCDKKSTLATFFTMESDYNSAIDAYQSIVKHAKNIKAKEAEDLIESSVTSLCILYMKMNKFEEALNIMTEFPFESNPGEFHFYRKSLCYEFLKLPEKSLEVIKRGLTLYPESSLLELEEKYYTQVLKVNRIKFLANIKDVAEVIDENSLYTESNEYMFLACAFPLVVLVFAFLVVIYILSVNPY